jgi:hypothetical protein
VLILVFWEDDKCAVTGMGVDLIAEELGSREYVAVFNVNCI